MSDYKIENPAGAQRKGSVSIRRDEFIKKVIQASLLALLALGAIILGGKAVNSGNCSACPGKGLCNGESDCAIFRK